MTATEPRRLALLPLMRVMLVFALLSGPADTKPRNDNIRISSDTAAFAEGRGIYQGNVELVRGALTIRAAQLVVTSKDGAVNLVVASGKPAEFLATGPDPVDARANSIEYRPAQEALVLLGNARVDREGSSIAGERIVYDSAANVVRANSDGDDSGSRVKMILQPATKRESSKDSNGSPESE